MVPIRKVELITLSGFENRLVFNQLTVRKQNLNLIGS